MFRIFEIFFCELRRQDTKSRFRKNILNTILSFTWFSVNLINIEQEIWLDYDQSNVLFARIIFCCIFLSAFSFLLTCI